METESPKMIKAIIFDMDGVIVDSEGLHVRAEKAAFNKFNLPVTENDWSGSKGRTSREFFAEMIQRYQSEANNSQATSEKIIAEKLAYLRKNANGLQLYPDFKELIAFIKEKYPHTALATSSSRDELQLSLDKFNLGQYFNAVIDGDMVKYGKPHPEPYLLAMQKLNVNPENCIIIEDADNGITAGKAAGARVIALTTSLAREKLQHADYIVDNLKEVKEIFEKY